MTHFIPNDLKYTNTHEWVRQDEDNIFTVGITHHAQGLLGDIVYVELPENQKAFKTGEGCAVIESVKAAADVYAPFACEVVNSNPNLGANPELINVDPYGEGWLFQCKMKDAADANQLLTADQYRSNIDKE